jgi:hypothetical protein
VQYGREARAIKAREGERADHVRASPGRFLFDEAISIVHATGEREFIGMKDGLAHAIADDERSRATDAALTMDEGLELAFTGAVDEREDLGGAEDFCQSVLVMGPWKLDII